MFLGTYQPRLDEKGRLILPAKFRDAIEAGQAAIDHQHVMNALQGHAQPRIAVAGDIHHMTAFAQPAQQVGRRASVIFNHENAQGSVSARQN